MSFEELEPRIPQIVNEATLQDAICEMGISVLDHLRKKVGGVSTNVQRSLLFSLKVSAGVSKVKYNPGDRKTRKPQATQQRVYDGSYPRLSIRLYYTPFSSGACV